MAQLIKVFAYKTDNLSLIPGFQTVDGENQFLKIVLCPPHVCWHICSHIYTNK